ncbi:N2227-like protein [Metarhizium album ARSEF 1941]|uniref:N2227-like protein n=1 Tax=Metarhizium album (strain ARSEF 1941) TaxID=1081103 RepID=A0A0B2X724_METAS|nr:N2227-like protein [Metarhizium album ARSEF 1941]KHO01250.1 N2227-like protein [Metarhizium album ARSEF 1941]
MARDHGTWSPHHPRHRLLDALHGFSKYYEQQRAEVHRLRGLYGQASPSQKQPAAVAVRAGAGGSRVDRGRAVDAEQFLEKHVAYSSKFKRVEQKLAANQHVCDDIVQAALAFYNIGADELRRHVHDSEAKGRRADKTSVSQSLKHIVRDWTGEGDNERNATFACLVSTLDRLFPDRNRNPLRDHVRLLLPGSGLGRLGHHIAQLGGFQVTVNEWSMYMNAVYRFLEARGSALSHSFHPFVDSWSHHVSDDDMNRAVRFPDVAVRPGTVLAVEGDFTTAFTNQSAHYDAVVTYFFIDTARNLMSYFDTISRVLDKGGVWINLGPLLYGTGPLVQLSLEDILAVTREMGFRFLETAEVCGDPTFSEPTVRSMEAVYSFDRVALTRSAYSAQFWAATKL